MALVVGTSDPIRRGTVAGLTAAIAFGLSAPASKWLLGRIDPLLLAGLLYLGAFVALSAWRRTSRQEARLRRADLPKLGVVVVSGGIAAPVLLLFGLDRLSGLTGSLLLNLEGVFTIVLGILWFGEHLGRRAWIGAIGVLGGAALLGLDGGGGEATVLGVALVLAACVGWAVDNNVTQVLTTRDPRQIVLVKAGVAGVFNVTLALALGSRLPAVEITLGALALGAVSYGLSILLDAYALRYLGAAREAVVFATAPFAGAALSIVLLSDVPSLVDGFAALGMLLGMALLLTDRHDHVHDHVPIVHEHVHVHDAHHRHHDGDVAEPHSHEHHHDALTHRHAHVSDVHHRHRH